MFLATTGLIEAWDASDELLVLQRGCLRHDRRSEWEVLRWRLAPNPWDDVRELERAKAYCGDVYEFMLPQVAGVMNRLHGQHESTSYWRIIVGPWLLHCVHVVYERYAALLSASRAQSLLRTRIMPDGPLFTPADTAEFLDLAAWSDHFNLQLYSDLLRRAGTGIVVEEIVPDSQALRPVTPTFVALRDRRTARRVVRRVLDVLPWLFPLVTPRVLIGDIDMSRADRAKLLWTLRRQRAATTALLPQSRIAALRNEGMRSAFESVHGRDQFTNVLVSILGRYVPLVHVEGFARARRRVNAACLRRPLVLASSTSWYTDESFKIVAAESEKTGSWLIGLQHGGGYGSCRVLPQEDLETAVVDTWLSYGWRPQRPGPITPFVHPRFQPPDHDPSRRSRAQNVVFVATNYHRYPIRFESHDIPLNRFDLGLALRERFVRALPAELHSSLVFALATKDAEWGQADRLRRLGVPLTVRTEGYRPCLPSARLLVVEYNGSATLELLTENVPVILFWSRAYDGLRPEAGAAYDRLRAAGILYDTPEEAAERVSMTYADPWSWWKQPRLQDARREFVVEHARGSASWLEEWTRMFTDASHVAGNRRSAIAGAAAGSRHMPAESSQGGPDACNVRSSTG